MAMALLGAGLAGCASGGRRSATAPTAPLAPLATAASPQVPTTARTAPTTIAPRSIPAGTVAAVPGYSDTTPPPRIHATGSDYAAIARSLFAYRDWLYVHHPDPALTAQVIRQGTISYAGEVAHLTTLRSRRQTLVSIGQRLTYTVASVQGWQMTLRVHQSALEDRVLDIDQRVVSITPYPPMDSVFLMTRDGGGRWRIADMTQVDLDPTIVLSP